MRIFQDSKHIYQLILLVSIDFFNPLLAWDYILSCFLADFFLTFILFPILISCSVFITSPQPPPAPHKVPCCCLLHNHLVCCKVPGVSPSGPNTALSTAVAATKAHEPDPTGCQLQQLPLKSPNMSQQGAEIHYSESPSHRILKSRSKKPLA